MLALWTTAFFLPARLNGPMHFSLLAMLPWFAKLLFLLIANSTSKGPQADHDTSTKYSIDDACEKSAG